MKMIVAVPFALLTLGVLGCSQQASTASTPAVQRAGPGAGSSETNTFGESKEAATGSAASAREAHYGTDQAPTADSASSSGGTAESTPPK